MSEKKIVISNSIGAILLQCVNVVNGFVVPKLLIEAYGSHMYGLTVSIIQFLNYITLLEGGLTSVTMAALYKPLLDNDSSKINGVVNATKKFFRQIAGLYIIYTICVAIIYPLIVDTGYDWRYCFVLVIVLSMNLFIQYFFSLTYKILLNAAKKVFFTSMIQIITQIVTIIGVVISVRVFDDIIMVKIVGALVCIIQPILFTIYVNHCFGLDASVEPSEDAISQRWDGFAQNLAYFIHTNTDVVVLTLFGSLEMVSVYSVYMLVANGLKMLAMAVSSAVSPSLGGVIATNDKKLLNRKFEKYMHLFTFIVEMLFCSGIALIVPFVKIYTRNFNDANYYNPIFAFIIIFAEYIYCIRDPFVNAIYASGHFKQTAKYSFVEAALNVVISILFVRKYGLIGVAIGTLISMIYRMIMVMRYCNARILGVKNTKFNKPIILNVFYMAFFAIVGYFLLDINFTNYIQWGLCGCTVLASCCLAYVVLYYIAGLVGKAISPK